MTLFSRYIMTLFSRYIMTRGIVLLFLDYGTRRGEGSASRPGRSLPQEAHGTQEAGSDSGG
jgi:hypothetical protein